MKDVEGYVRQKFRTQNFDSLVGKCQEMRGYGFELSKAKKVRHWPFFWIVTYKVTFRKHFIVDGKSDTVSYYSKEDIRKLLV